MSEVTQTTDTPAAEVTGTPDWRLARRLVEPLYREQKLFTGEDRLTHADGMADILRGVRDDDVRLTSLTSPTACMTPKSGLKKRSDRWCCSLSLTCSAW